MSLFTLLMRYYRLRQRAYGYDSAPRLLPMFLLSPRASAFQMLMFCCCMLRYYAAAISLTMPPARVMRAGGAAIYAAAACHT